MKKMWKSEKQKRNDWPLDCLSELCTRACRSYTDMRVDAHRSMAANIDQIFQDFILNKIKEIEDQNDDKAYAIIVFCIRFT